MVVMSYFVIGSKRYRFVRKDLGHDPKDGKKIWGLCDSPIVKKKAIYVCIHATGFHELDVILHEIKHAENWEGYNENYVDTFSYELANYVWEADYKKRERPTMGLTGFTRLEAVISRARFKLEGHMYEPEYIKRASHEMALILWKLCYRNKK